jgi:hypothetical protein
MADVPTYNPILIAGITASAAIIGGLMSSGANYLIEKQRNKREAVMFQRNKETREIELRNQAYIKFLSIAAWQVNEVIPDGSRKFNPGLAAESVALVLTYGSPAAANIVNSAYPFENWEALEGVKKAIMKELLLEKSAENTVLTVSHSAMEQDRSAILDESE